MNAMSRLFLLTAVLAGCAGMAMGLVMGILHDFSLTAAHAHLNLVGWATMCLVGLFYAVHPRAAEGVLPRVHYGLAAVGMVLMAGGLIGVGSGAMALEPVLVVGAILTLLAMLLFAVIAFRALWPVPAPA